MFFLLSGEGISDLGASTGSESISEGESFAVGPMTIIISKIVEARHEYSILDGACGYVSERRLVELAQDLKCAKKQLRLPGKKREKETRYFFNNARVLARLAKAKAADLGDDVVAILFRDTDGTASAGRGEWHAKRESMLQGFAEEGFDKGVPMLPKPKSEAWLICAWKRPPYNGCQDLEERSGNDASPNSLKKQLAAILKVDEVKPDLLCLMTEQHFDIDRLKMPSFTAFRTRLEDVIA